MRCKSCGRRKAISGGNCKKCTKKLEKMENQSDFIN